jgi:nucleoside-diphosphate-sugar epimerase
MTRTGTIDNDKDKMSRPNPTHRIESCETVFHLAANPEVRINATSPKVLYKQNVPATFNLLEAIRKVGNVKALLFTSSSAVYGEAMKVPIPEDCSPLRPISICGSSKLSSEALIMGYAYTYGFRAIIYRLANIVGSRNTHGVVGRLCEGLFFYVILSSLVWICSGHAPIRRLLRQYGFASRPSSIALTSTIWDSAFTRNV